MLKESGPTPGDENGTKSKRGDESAKKKKRPDKGVCMRGGVKIFFWCPRKLHVLIMFCQVDMEKLADNLQKLGEDDLLQVVEMVHNNKTADTYTKNDVERKPSDPFFWFFFSFQFLFVVCCLLFSLHSIQKIKTN